MTKYRVYIYTGEADSAGTDAKVYLRAYGTTGTLYEADVNDPDDKDDFEAGETNTFVISSPSDIGNITKISIGHNNSNKNPGWYLDGVKIINESTRQQWNFPAYRWLAKDEGDGKTSITLTPGPEMVHYDYICNYPKDRENGWSNECNGVCHDNNNWYFTQDGNIWKFPIAHDLNNSCKSEDINQKIYKYHYGHHLGDIDCYNNYLFVPVSGHGNPYIAVFPTSNIHQIVGKQTMYIDNTVFNSIGWLAINPNDGKLYTSPSSEINGPSHPIVVYTIDFQALKNGNGPFLKQYAKICLIDENGNSLKRGSMQGGCFDQQNHLHLSNGYYHDYANRSGGITVYDIPALTKGQTAKIKVKARSNQSHHFRFQFNSYGEEPEGITYWDLDGKNVPGITGQLHAIMIDNAGTKDDDLYFKHFRRI